VRGKQIKKGQAKKSGKKGVRTVQEAVEREYLPGKLPRRKNRAGKLPSRGKRRGTT